MAVSVVTSERPSSEMVYQFRSGARVPRGVTPEGVLAEREAVVALKGAATASCVADAILENEAAFPNLRPWGPSDKDVAFRQGIERGVRLAFASVVVVRTTTRPGHETERREIRVLQAVPPEPGRARSYELLNVIARDPEKRKWLMEQLRADADAFARRLRDVLAEIAMLLEEAE